MIHWSPATSKEARRVRVVRDDRAARQTLIVAAAGLGVLLLLIWVVALTWRAEPLDQPIVPPAPEAAGLSWFAGDGPGADSGPGIWRRDAVGQRWSWQPLAQTAVTPRTYDEAGTPPEPAWPQDAAQVATERVTRSSGTLVGYWVWNPAIFADSDVGGAQWSPRWQWAAAGQPLLLAEAPKQQ
jgi:hypothetical protein